MTHDDLGTGPAATALHEMVVARTTGDWTKAHAAAKAMTSQPITADPASANLYRGAPAVAYILHTAGHRAYARALTDLNAETVAIVTHRLDAAHRRMDNGLPPRLREYDLISGLTGLGAYFLHRDVDRALGAVLRYLVRLLTEPLVVDGHQVPGWWAATSPNDTPDTGEFTHGHANFGLAHGMAGPLALLALARRAGHTVAGQDDALATGITHLTTWAQPLKGGGTGWPECLPLDAYRHGPQPDAAPTRASWCYGTPGIARALQLAALALNDDTARRLAEHTALQAATDPRNTRQITDTSLCHGWAGLLLTTERIAADAARPDLHDALPALRDRLTTETQHHPAPEHAGLLTGPAGVLLTLHTLTTARPVDPEWETCLLLTP
ncbi:MULTISPECIES: lanthionine synthetase C family protein [unclassified Streptomyces]|uniref:lanthionine synthetase C family protein n=1 Tax=Streptomyces TaxID=1883 RepID=UPI0004C949E3|nr:MULTISPECIES: lanthionine synthetase C family protein [unclassified Streptomyces]